MWLGSRVQQDETFFLTHATLEKTTINKKTHNRLYKKWFASSHTEPPEISFSLLLQFVTRAKKMHVAALKMCLFFSWNEEPLNPMPCKWRLDTKDIKTQNAVCHCAVKLLQTFSFSERPNSKSLYPWTAVPIDLTLTRRHCSDTATKQQTDPDTYAEAKADHSQPHPHQSYP